MRSWSRIRDHKHGISQLVTTVVAAIIRDSQHRLLLGKRQDYQQHAGFWEFPGGKVHAGETLEAALQRETMEEIGLCIIQFEMYAQKNWCYHNMSVELHFYLVQQYTGSPTGREGQELRWYDKKDIAGIDILEANKSVVQQLQQDGRI